MPNHPYYLLFLSRLTSIVVLLFCPSSCFVPDEIALLLAAPYGVALQLAAPYGVARLLAALRSSATIRYPWVASFI